MNSKIQYQFKIQIEKIKGKSPIEPVKKEKFIIMFINKYKKCQIHKISLKKYTF